MTFLHSYHPYVSDLKCPVVIKMISQEYMHFKLKQLF